MVGTARVFKPAMAMAALSLLLTSSLADSLDRSCDAEVQDCKQDVGESLMQVRQKAGQRAKPLHETVGDKHKKHAFRQTPEEVALAEKEKTNTEGFFDQEDEKETEKKEGENAESEESSESEKTEAEQDETSNNLEESEEESNENANDSSEKDESEDKEQSEGEEEKKEDQEGDAGKSDGDSDEKGARSKVVAGVATHETAAKKAERE